MTYHRAVHREVEEACDWYDERTTGLGDEFFQELERVLGLIKTNPQAFPLALVGRRKAHTLYRRPTPLPAAQAWCREN